MWIYEYWLLCLVPMSLPTFCPSAHLLPNQNCLNLSQFVHCSTVHAWLRPLTNSLRHYSLQNWIKIFLKGTALVKIYPTAMQTKCPDTRWALSHKSPNTFHPVGVMVTIRSCQQLLRKFVVLGNPSDYNPHWSKECKAKPGGTGRY